ncbi:MAG TPA: hypothetical protein VHB46_06070 [Burkholderiales bacterium]|nr:hypothetical protein [Burkholderiales bacterium]
MDNSLQHNLHADGPAADRAGKMMLYGQFVGSWDGRLRYLDAEGVRRETTAEVHFGWVLEGRAVQDVWIAPSRIGRKPDDRLLMHGSTFRIYDPQNDIWHITWLDPVKQLRNTMTGQAVGNDIVQEYRANDGRRIQWTFTEITPDSFHWTNRDSADGGGSWMVRGEFFLKRRAN